MQLFENEVETDLLNAAADGRARFIRLRAQWRYVEPLDMSPPAYGWSGTDSAMQRIATHGLTPIVTVYGNPSWAATTDCGPVDLVPLSRFGAFVEALVERYDGDGTADAPGSPRVAHWEFSNEPDFDLDHAGGESDYGSCFGGLAPDYGRYLRTAYLAAKDADATSTVLFGGVAYDRFHNKGGYSPTGPFDYQFVGATLDWLHDHYGSDPDWPFFDWMAVHVYNDFRNNWDGTQPYNQELVGKVAHLRTNQLLSVGDYDLRSLPIAITEASIASMPTDAYTNRSEAIQAAYPGQLLIRGRSLGARHITWFSLEDHRTGACSNPYDWLGLGLLRSLAVYEAAQDCDPNPIPDYEVSEPHEPKPAHTAYRTAVDELAGATYDRQLSVAETGSAQLEAYRFQRADTRWMIAAFTDNGERLGRIGSPPVGRSLVVSASILPGWTGTVAITDHLGEVTYRSGTSVTVTVTQWPVYIRTD